MSSTLSWRLRTLSSPAPARSQMPQAEPLSRVPVSTRLESEDIRAVITITTMMVLKEPTAAMKSHVRLFRCKILALPRSQLRALSSNTMNRSTHVAQRGLIPVGTKRSQFPLSSPSSLLHWGYHHRDRLTSDTTYRRHITEEHQREVQHAQCHWCRRLFPQKGVYETHTSKNGKDMHCGEAQDEIAPWPAVTHEVLRKSVPTGALEMRWRHLFRSLFPQCTTVPSPCKKY